MSPLSAANRLRLAAALGLALAALSASSVVAWKFGHARELGQPLWGAFYHPLAVVAWLRAWGDLDGYRQPFLQALSLVLVVAVITGGGSPSGRAVRPVARRAEAEG